MAIDLTLFGTRDAKLIRENPKATPYELLELGLSHKAYTRLTAEPSNQLSESESTPENPAAIAPSMEAAPELQISHTVTALRPDVVEEVPVKQPAAPRFGPNPRYSAFNQAQQPFAGFGQVTIVGPTGIPQRMAEKQARKMVARNPTLYKII